MIDEKKLIEERPEWMNPDCAGNEEYNKGWNACNKYWCNTIKRQPKIGKWIPCSERLPDKPIFSHDGYIVQQACVVEPYTAYWDGEKWSDVIDNDIEDIIAWQPLPAPYKPEGE